MSRTYSHIQQCFARKIQNPPSNRYFPEVMLHGNNPSRIERTRLLMRINLVGQAVEIRKVKPASRGSFSPQRCVFWRCVTLRWNSKETDDKARKLQTYLCGVYSPLGDPSPEAGVSMGSVPPVLTRSRAHAQRQQRQPAGRTDARSSASARCRQVWLEEGGGATWWSGHSLLIFSNVLQKRKTKKYVRTAVFTLLKPGN